MAWQDTGTSGDVSICHLLAFAHSASIGPRAIREASTLFSSGHSGAYDHEDDVTDLDGSKVAIVDLGDADIIHTDTTGSHGSIKQGVR